ncbi:hypothetical protein ACFL6E_00825 [Candidatus Neomarinimicrobiota bacterium]
MLAVALSESEVRYISWERIEEEIRLKACQVITWEERLDGFGNLIRIKDYLRQIIADTDTDHKIIFMTMDVRMCNYRLQQIDPAWDAVEQLDFLSNQRYGQTTVFDSFHYELRHIPGQVFTIECPHDLRIGLSELLKEDETASLLSMGIFAAYNYACKVVPNIDTGHRIIWRASSRGAQQLLEIDSGEFVALHISSRNGDGSLGLQTYGAGLPEGQIIEFLNSAVKNEQPDLEGIDGIYTYFGSGSHEFMELILSGESDNISLLNPFWRWNWPDVPGADNKYAQSAFTELAEAIWLDEHV